MGFQELWHTSTSVIINWHVSIVALSLMLDLGNIKSVRGQTGDVNPVQLGMMATLVQIDLNLFLLEENILWQYILKEHQRIWTKKDGCEEFWHVSKHSDNSFNMGICEFFYSFL